MDGFGRPCGRRAYSSLAFLYSPEMGYDGDTTSMHCHHCRISSMHLVQHILPRWNRDYSLIRVRHIFGQVFDHQGFRLPFHISANETGQVQIRPPIQVKLVFEHLMHGVCRCTLPWDLELGDLLLRSVARGVRRDGRSSTLGVDMVLVGFRWMIVETFDDLIRIHLRREALA